MWKRAKKGGSAHGQDLKIESLDDLFEEDKIEEIKNADAPVLPQEEMQNKKEQENDMDLQKELEAKFDELFGPIDEEK